jgi:DNA-binding response OmpR family regulator
VGFSVGLLGDDQAVLAVLAEGLTEQGFYVTLGQSAEGVGGTDIVIVDAPAMVAELRRAGADLPILALNAAPVAGATETLSKPVRMATLAARVRSLVEDAGLLIGPWRFIVPTRQLKRGAGEVVRLTPKEAEILHFLYQAAGPVPRSDLLGAIWGYSEQVDTHTVETHIHGLRRKLGADVLMTDVGGYRLNKSV